MTGASAALFLARRGVAVDLFDMAARPFSGASRWNEGKIHLGFIYNADPTLMTAKKVIPGGLLFKPIIEDLLSCSLGPVTTAQDDLYLCHSRSVVKPDAMQGYLSRVSDIFRQSPDARCYLADASRCESARLDAHQLGAITDSPEIVAGFRVPERSVSTLWIADRFVGALQAEPGIRLMLGQHILSAHPRSEGRFAASSTLGATERLTGTRCLPAFTISCAPLPNRATAISSPTGCVTALRKSSNLVNACIRVSAWGCPPNRRRREISRR